MLLANIGEGVVESVFMTVILALSHFESLHPQMWVWPQVPLAALPPCAQGPLPHTSLGRPLPEHCKMSQGGWRGEEGGGEGGEGRAVAQGGDGGTFQRAVGAGPTSGGLSMLSHCESLRFGLLSRACKRACLDEGFLIGSSWDLFLFAQCSWPSWLADLWRQDFLWVVLGQKAPLNFVDFYGDLWSWKSTNKSTKKSITKTKFQNLRPNLSRGRGVHHSTPNMTGQRFHRTMEMIPALPW